MKEYSVLLHIAIEPTTQRSHVHTLGRCDTCAHTVYCAKQAVVCAITYQVVSGCNYYIGERAGQHQSLPQ